uniref:Uncharacterized protein n=1 Tax=Anopheles merus TaxID=30066 RepID=A0A182VET0_ANOME
MKAPVDETLLEKRPASRQRVRFVIHKHQHLTALYNPLPASGVAGVIDLSFAPRLLRVERAPLSPDSAVSSDAVAFPSGAFPALPPVASSPAALPPVPAACARSI